MGCLYVDWDAVAAVGTWVTGLAAGAVAWQAYRFTKRAGDRERSATSRRCRAYSTSAYLEVKSLAMRAEGLASEVAKSVSLGTDARSMIPVMAAMPSFEPSKWLVESPSMGELSIATSSLLARALAAASEAERIRLMFCAFAERPPTNPIPPVLLQKTHEMLTDLVSKADAVLPLLSRRAGLS